MVFWLVDPVINSGFCNLQKSSSRDNSLKHHKSVTYTWPFVNLTGIGNIHVLFTCNQNVESLFVCPVGRFYWFVPLFDIHIWPSNLSHFTNLFRWLHSILCDGMNCGYICAWKTGIKKNIMIKPESRYTKRIPYQCIPHFISNVELWILYTIILVFTTDYFCKRLIFAWYYGAKCNITCSLVALFNDLTICESIIIASF